MEERFHYSQTLGRLLRQGDYITIDEVVGILSKNSGVDISCAFAISFMTNVGISSSGEILYDDVRDLMATTEERFHYSHARGHLLRDGDYISIPEAVAILSENRCAGITRKSATSLMAKASVRKIVDDHNRMYLYDDIRDMVVKRNRGRHFLDNPTPGAIRAREFRERRRKAASEEAAQRDS